VIADEITPPKPSFYCDCCDRRVPYVRGSQFHGDFLICLACFLVWYDGGQVVPAKIKAAVLAAEAVGEWPFTDTDLRLRRVEEIS
jgi:hypothetical protein